VRRGIHGVSSCIGRIVAGRADAHSCRHSPCSATCINQPLPESDSQSSQAAISAKRDSP
jgi:hypothetical protein